MKKFFDWVWNLDWDMICTFVVIIALIAAMIWGIATHPSIQEVG